MLGSGNPIADGGAALGAIGQACAVQGFSELRRVDAEEPQGAVQPQRSDMPKGAAKGLLEAQAKMPPPAPKRPQSHAYQNIKVNQDRNPWPKVDIASAVDHRTRRAWVVMTHDFRVNFPRCSITSRRIAGKTWTDDMLVEGADPIIGSIPLSFQLDPGAFIRRCRQQLSFGAQRQRDRGLHQQLLEYRFRSGRDVQGFCATVRTRIDRIPLNH